MEADSVLVAGETLVDLFPDGTGDLAAVEGFCHRAGGAPANVAVALARLDSPPQFWTRLGSDPFGDYLADVLADNGVDGEFVIRGDGATSLAVVSPTPDGDRSFTFYEADTATLHFQPCTVPEDALADCECVHVGGVALANDTGRPATLDLAERARDAGCTVSFDPNTRLDLWADPGEASDVFGDALALTDVLCSSADDLVTFGVDPSDARRDPERVAADLLEAGPHTVFLTLGSEGATVVSAATADGERVAVSEPAFDVQVEDTTGAGDAFTAAALSRYETGSSESALRDALRYANAAGALTTTATGGMAALPDASAVADLLAD